MVRSVLRGFAMVLVGSLVSTGLSVDLYWTHGISTDGRVSRAGLPNGPQAPLIPGGLPAPYRIAVDPQHSYMYWNAATATQSAGGVWRANLDGSNAQRLIPLQIPSGTVNLGIAVDAVSQKVFWNQGTHVFAANLDGSGPHEIVNVSGSSLIQDLTIDPVSQKLYLSDFGGSGNGRLRRTNLDGTGLETVINNIVNGPIGVGIDSANGVAYWAAYNLTTETGAVRRASLDGSNLETIVDDIAADSLALDLAGGKVYWTEPYLPGGSNDGSIHRANLDGTNVESDLFGATAIGGLAIVPEPATASLLLLAIAIPLIQRRARTTQR